MATVYEKMLEAGLLNKEIQLSEKNKNLISGADINEIHTIFISREGNDLDVTINGNNAISFEDKNLFKKVIDSFLKVVTTDNEEKTAKLALLEKEVKDLLK